MLVSGPTGTKPQILVLSAHVDDEPHGVGAIERSGRRREIRTIEAALAVDVAGVLRFADERAVGARVHGDVDAEQVTHHECIVRRARQWRIAGHGRDADQVGVPRGDHDGDGVVVAGIAVEQHPRSE